MPAEAQAVALNVTAVDPVAPGYLTAFPCGPWTGVSNAELRHEPGRRQPRRGPTRRPTAPCASWPTPPPTSCSTWSAGGGPTGERFAASTPQRLLDTRGGGAAARSPRVPSLSVPAGEGKLLNVTAVGPVDLRVPHRLPVRAQALGVDAELRRRGRSCPTWRPSPRRQRPGLRVPAAGRPCGDRPAGRLRPLERRPGPRGERARPRTLRRGRPSREPVAPRVHHGEAVDHQRGRDPRRPVGVVGPAHRRVGTRAADTGPCRKAATSRPRPWRSEPSKRDCPPLTPAEPSGRVGVGAAPARAKRTRRERDTPSHRGAAGRQSAGAEVEHRLVPRPRLAGRQRGIGRGLDLT